MAVFSRVPLLRTLAQLCLTFAVGVMLICALVYAPSLAAAPQPNSAPNSRLYAKEVQSYLAGLLRGNVASGGDDRPVRRALLDSARRSLELLAISLAFAVPIGLLWGVALAQQRWWLHGWLFGVNALFNALPSFLVLLMGMEIASTITVRTGIQLTYMQGYGLDKHLLLPVLALALRGSAFIALRVYDAQTEMLGEDWLRGARAKGLGGFRLWRNHMLPALRLPLISIGLGVLRVMLAGLVIIDVLYKWGGLGTRMLGTGASPTASATAVGAGIMLFAAFVFADLLGRIGLRYAEPRLRGS